MPETTVFLLYVVHSNIPHGPVRDLYRGHGVSNQIKSMLVIDSRSEEMHDIQSRPSARLSGVAGFVYPVDKHHLPLAYRKVPKHGSYFLCA